MVQGKKDKNERIVNEPGSTAAAKTMLILKSNASALATVETFLRNRGWKIYSTANLKDALVQIVQGRPSYVLISVDHPNKKVRALPKLIGQALPVAVIAFAENQNSISYKLLNESATEYRVYPPVTGPAIERCVNKYLKDLQTRESLQSANNDFRPEGSSDDKNNGMISVKGGGPGTIGSDQASRLFSQLLSDEPGITTTATSGKSDSGVIFAQPADDDEGPKHGNVAYMPGSTGGPGAADSSHGSQQNPFGGGTYIQKGAAGNFGNYVPPSSESGHSPGSTTQQGLAGSLMQSNSSQGSSPLMQSNSESGSEAPHLQANTGGVPANDDLTSTQQDKAGGALGSREYRRKQAAAAKPLWAPREVSVERQKFLDERRRQSDSNQTLMARGTQHSLDEAVDKKDGVVHETIQDASNMACIIVDSERFSGYLIAVMGNDQKIEGEFIAKVKKRLFKFLKDNGEDMSEEEAMGLKVKQVDFEPWALEYAEFLRKSVHDGKEVAMAFFPRRPPRVIIEDSQHHEMAKIQLGDLVGDRHVEFDLYMYLPTNNKYVLYTPKGGVFYNKQLERLKDQGVTHMHIQKDAIKAVSKYKAQNYLNDLVDDYDQKTAFMAPSQKQKAS